MVSVLKTVKNTDRLRQILTVFAKHGFGELLARTGLPSLIPGKRKESDDSGAGSTKTFAVRLREALQELGPSFVKLGQIVSTRPDLIPADLIVELKLLQDSVPPMSFADVQTTLSETFGGTESELFASFTEEPLASASIGQVHCATVLIRDDSGPEGVNEIQRDVVVKVQRPGIRPTIERDLDLLYLMAGLVERHIPESKIYSPAGLVGEFDRAIMAELDFTVEADNAKRFARHFHGNPIVRFPHVYAHASGKRVLTMERFVGKKVYDFVAGNSAGEQVAKNALHIIAKMIFEDGFFHADPHPGNIIMMGSPEDPVIGMIDLGLVGRLSPSLRDKLIQLMIAAVTEDAEALANALLGMGRPRGRIDLPAFHAEVEVLASKYLGKPVAEIEMSAMIRDLVQGAVKYDIEMPVEMMMVGKALMTVEGIGKEIHPELDVWSELKPYFMKLLWHRYNPERLGRDLLKAVTQLSNNAGNLPEQLNDILNDLRSGQLRIQTADPQLPAASDRLGRRIFTGATTGSLLLAGTALLIAGKYESMALTLIAFAAVQVVWHYLSDWRRNRD